MRITKLERTDGHWTARVSGEPVTRRFGSWGTPPDEEGRWHEVPPTVAAKLQEKVGPIERAERKAREAARKAVLA